MKNNRKTVGCLANLTLALAFGLGGFGYPSPTEACDRDCESSVKFNSTCDNTIETNGKDYKSWVKPGEFTYDNLAINCGKAGAPWERLDFYFFETDPESRSGSTYLSTDTRYSSVGVGGRFSGYSVKARAASNEQLELDFYYGTKQGGLNVNEPVRIELVDGEEMQIRKMPNWRLQVPVLTFAEGSGKITTGSLAITVANGNAFVDKEPIIVDNIFGSHLSHRASRLIVRPKPNAPEDFHIFRNGAVIKRQNPNYERH